MSRILIIAFMLSAALTSYGQSQEELANRAVFNKLEFFINTKNTDSIYNLASDNFKSKIGADQFGFTMNNLYQLGKIKNVEVLDFKQQSGVYLLTYPTAFIKLTLSVDPSTLKYEGILFSPGEKPAAKPVEKKEVVSVVEKISPVDFFVDSVAKPFVKQGNAQSLAIGVFHDGQYNKYFYGEAIKGSGVAPTENTIYEIGSITKVFTAVLLADLVTKGTTKLDDPITAYLPDSLASNPDLQKITFKSLSNHSSGLPRLANNMDKVPGFTMKDPYANYDRKALFSYLKNYKATREVGETYEYSNLGVGLLGELISIIAKKPFTQQLREVVLTPLQMNSTTDRPDPKNTNFIKVYNASGIEVPTWNFQSMFAAGGLKSTVRDMMLFAVEQFKMPQNGLQAAMGLTREFTLATPNNTDIGLGWHMNMVDQGIFLWHNGGTGGSRSFLGISPDSKTAVVVLSNAELAVDSVGASILKKLMESKN